MGVQHNLSSYRENTRRKPATGTLYHVKAGSIVKTKKKVPMGFMAESDLEFDIERYVTDEGTSPKYSMMINGYYPYASAASRPTREDFSRLVSELGGFKLQYNRRDKKLTEFWGNRLIEYRHDKKNIFVNWSLGEDVVDEGKYRICIGVIQRKPVPDLQVVSKEIVPYAASIFNKLSPTIKLEQAVVKASVKLALRNSRTAPFTEHCDERVAL